MTDSLLSYSSFYLVGIKGVAMTALAQCLVDADKQVTGSDVVEDFVTKKQLDRLNLSIDHDFDPVHLSAAQCVIYTAAHSGPDNPQVQAARERGLPLFSHAQALADLFNQKQGIAVCGVGGKSTTSAMITWILVKTAATSKQLPSFAVGVGDIPGLNKTGAWQGEAPYFVAEADEYVTDPKAPSRNEPITPRFSFMKPTTVICTNLQFDHPDVYRDFNHTKKVYSAFFSQIKPGGQLIVNADDQELLQLASKAVAKHQLSMITFGRSTNADVQLLRFSSQEGETTSHYRIQSDQFSLKLAIPGEFNAMNALAAIAACLKLNIAPQTAADALLDFHSTMRRSEFVGEKAGVKYYDDYAHHPSEVANIIKAFQDWYPHSRIVVAFQSHTFSRTTELFDDFVHALGTAREIVMIDIFASARELFDDNMTSDLLCEAIEKAYPQTTATNLKTIEALASFCKTKLNAGDVLLTVGAGDIYQVHQLI